MTTSPESAPTQEQSQAVDQSPEADALEQFVEVENEDQNEQEELSPISLSSEGLINESDPFKLFDQVGTASERLDSTDDINDAVANYQFNVGLNLADTLPKIIEERTGKKINVDPTEFHVDADWWSDNISSDTNEQMAAQFDTAYADFVSAKIDEILEKALLSPEELSEGESEDSAENTLPDAPEIEEAQNDFDRYEALTENNRELANKLRGKFLERITVLMDNLDAIEQAKKDAETAPDNAAATDNVVSLAEQREAKLVEARADLESVFKELEAQAA